METLAVRPSSTPRHATPTERSSRDLCAPCNQDVDPPSPVASLSHFSRTTSLPHVPREDPFYLHVTGLNDRPHQDAKVPSATRVAPSVSNATNTTASSTSEDWSCSSQQTNQTATTSVLHENAVHTAVPARKHVPRQLTHWDSLSTDEKQACRGSKCPTKRVGKHAWSISGQLEETYRSKLKKALGSVINENKESILKKSQCAIHFDAILLSDFEDGRNPVAVIVILTGNAKVGDRARNVIRQSSKYKKLNCGFRLDVECSKITIVSGDANTTAFNSFEANDRIFACGKPAFLRRLPFTADPAWIYTTLGGVLLVRGIYYALIAAHCLSHFNMEDEEPEPELTDVETNTYSLSSEIDSDEDGGFSIVSSATDDDAGSKDDTQQLDIPSLSASFALYLDYAKPVQQELDGTNGAAQRQYPGQPTLVGRLEQCDIQPRGASCGSLVSTEDDWALVPILDPRYEQVNQFVLPDSSVCTVSRIEQSDTAFSNQVYIAAGSGLRGISIVGRISSIMLPWSNKLHDVLSIDTAIDPGDSGSWLFDRDGHLYGIAVATAPDLSMTFILKAGDIFASITAQLQVETAHDMMFPTSSQRGTMLSAYDSISKSRPRYLNATDEAIQTSLSDQPVTTDSLKHSNGLVNPEYKSFHEDATQAQRSAEDASNHLPVRSISDQLEARCDRPHSDRDDQPVMLAVSSGRQQEMYQLPSPSVFAVQNPLAQSHPAQDSGKEENRNNSLSLPQGVHSQNLLLYKPQREIELLKDRRFINKGYPNTVDSTTIHQDHGAVNSDAALSFDETIQLWPFGGTRLLEDHLLSSSTRESKSEGTLLNKVKSFDIFFDDFVGLSNHLALSYPSHLQGGGSTVKLVQIKAANVDHLTQRRQIHFETPGSEQNFVSYWLPYDGVLVEEINHMIYIEFSDGRQKQVSDSNGQISYYCRYDWQKPNIKMYIRIADTESRRRLIDAILLRDNNHLSPVCHVKLQGARNKLQYQLSIQDLSRGSPLATKQCSVALVASGSDNPSLTWVFYLGNLLDFRLDHHAELRSACLRGLYRMKYLSNESRSSIWPPEWVRENMNGTPNAITLEDAEPLDIHFLPNAGHPSEKVRTASLERLLGWSLKYTERVRVSVGRQKALLPAQVTMWSRWNEVRLLARTMSEGTSARVVTDVKWIAISLTKTGTQSISGAFCPRLHKTAKKSTLILKKCDLSIGNWIRLPDFAACNRDREPSLERIDIELSFENSNAARDFTRCLRQMAEIRYETH